MSITNGSVQLKPVFMARKCPKTWSDLHIWEGFITFIVISLNKKGAKTCVKYKWGNQTGMMGSSGAPGTVFGSRFWQQHTYVIKVSLTQAVALNI